MVVILILTIGLIGCASETDKKADQFIGVWQYSDPNPNANDWAVYYVISKVDGQKGYYQIEKKSIALSDGKARKKGQTNKKMSVSKIDQDGILRFENSTEFIMINKDATEITKDGEAKYHKVKELPESLKVK